jgi:hypothetical protein
MTAIVAALGLVVSGRAYAAEEKSETKTEHQADEKGSSTKVEKSKKHAGAKHDEKSTVEHKKTAGGKTETTKETKKSSKPGAHAKTHKTESKEKVVKDPQGNVVEQEKTSK